MKKPIFYSDPGHGWLAVPRAELVKLDIMHKISTYSYQREGTVYLEEDCDLALYIEAIQAKGGTFEYTSAKPANNESRIRSYRSFTPTTAEMGGKERLPAGWQFAARSA